MSIHWGLPRLLLVGSLTCKNRLPYNLYCVGGDVKHCSLQWSIHCYAVMFTHLLRKLECVIWIAERQLDTNCNVGKFYGFILKHYAVLIQVVNWQLCSVVHLVCLALSILARMCRQMSAPWRRCRRRWRRLSSSYSNYSRNSFNWWSCSNRNRNWNRSSPRRPRPTAPRRHCRTTFHTRRSCFRQHQRTHRSSWRRRSRHRMRATTCLWVDLRQTQRSWRRNRRPDQARPVPRIKQWIRRLPWVHQNPSWCGLTHTICFTLHQLRHSSLTECIPVSLDSVFGQCVCL